MPQHLPGDSAASIPGVGFTPKTSRHTAVTGQKIEVGLSVEESTRKRKIIFPLPWLRIPFLEELNLGRGERNLRPRILGKLNRCQKIHQKQGKKIPKVHGEKSAEFSLWSGQKTHP